MTAAIRAAFDRLEAHMIKSPIARALRVTRLFGRRKIETVTLSVVAALSAIGIARQDGPAGTVADLTRTAVASVATSAHAPPAVAATGAASGGASATAATTLDLAMISNPRVDSWIKRFTTDLRSSYATYLDRMNRYEQLISGRLEDRDMPPSLIYLAMIESGFNPTAKSRVKASGLWQFMTATARQAGLRVSRKVDERNDPARSTDAALKYLSYLHDRFGSWYLAAAAYNGGEGTVAKALKRVTGKTRGTDADFYRISAKLPRETRDYVPKLIAAAHIGQNPGRYGFSND